MNINLIINGENREFTAPFIPARMLKKTIQIGNSIEKDAENENNFDTMAQYIAEIYGNQFSADDVLDGLSSVDLIKEFTNCVTAVTGNLSAKVEELSVSNPNQ